MDNRSLHSRLRRSVGMTVFAILAACAPSAPPPQPDHQAISLLGDTLRTPPLDSTGQAGALANLDTARTTYESDTTSADALIWLGRRTAYLGRYREAIEIFSTGVERFPNDARFLRHRGHRYITLRELDRAIADFRAATQLIAGRDDEIEPDGLPNARGIPTSTLHSNIWYHLGLAHYLKGDFRQALAAYEQEAAVASNPDMLVATSWWRYLTLRRLQQDTAADSVLMPITDTLDIIENQSYHNLLLLAKGMRTVDEQLVQDPARDTPADAAVQYGVGVWYLVEGVPERADSLFRDLKARGNWAAFGVIAAEAELSRRIES
jgi:tetratricopeptide (TPR) repeat protein